MSASAQALLTELRTLGVDVVATGDRIRYRPLGAVSLDLRERLREHKEALLELLRGTPPPEVPSPGPESAKVETVRDRLAALLEGRLWQDSDGWWPKVTGLSPSHAARVADAAMVAVPEEHPGVPGPMTAARGAIAVRAWHQVVACVVAELGWSVDRAAGVAALVVDPCFDLATPDREGQA